MAIGVIGYRAPDKEKEASDLDKALGLAKLLESGTSIYKNLKPEKAEKVDEGKQLDIKEKRLASQGIISPAKTLDFQKDFDPAKEGDAGAFPVKVQNADGTVTTQLAKRKAPSDLTQLIGALTVQQKTGEINKQKTESETAKGPQAQAALFGKRMEQAEAVMGSLVSQGYDRTKQTEDVKNMLPNAALGKQLQQQNQAERNFVNSILRKESGAAIADSEFASAEKQYFPRSGDSPEVLAQKAQNRQQAIEALKAEAGPAWKLVKTAPLPSSGTKPTEKTGPHGPTVNQGGIIYNWNQKTGKYE